MKYFILFFAFGLGFGNYIYAAENSSADCIDKDRIDKTWNTFDFRTEYNRDGSAVIEKVDRCDSKSVVYKVLKAWHTMEDLPLLNAKEDAFNQSAFGVSATRFVKNRIKTLTFDTAESDTCKNGAAAYVVNSQDMAYICPASGQFSTLFLMDVLIHESRHVDGYPHSPCARGFLKDEVLYACDKSYSAHGSYGIGAEFKVRVARTENVNLALRSEARAEALSDFMTRFNSLPLGLQEGLFCSNNNSRAVFFLLIRL